VRFLLTGRRRQDADVPFLRMSRFMLSLPSVSDVRNYLNVWSSSIMFSPPNINTICLQASSDPFIHSLFRQVKMSSARVVFQIFISKSQLERE
jgi:hypothetical protein